jgi:hypothetical protein
MPPPTIDVQHAADGDLNKDLLTFFVTVREGESATQHRVTMTQATNQRLTGGKVPATRCIEAAFRFPLAF